MTRTKFSNLHLLPIKERRAPPLPSTRSVLPSRLELLSVELQRRDVTLNGLLERFWDVAICGIALKEIIKSYIEGVPSSSFKEE